MNAYIVIIARDSLYSRLFKAEEEGEEKERGRNVRREIEVEIGIRYSLSYDG